MYSPYSNQRMVEVMEQLGPKVALPIATCIGQMESLDHQLAESEGQTDFGSDADSMMSPDRVGSPQVAGVQRDPELEREERLIQAYSRIKSLEERNVALNADLTETRINAGQLEDELTDLKYRVEKGGLKGADNDMLEQLKHKSAQDKEHIEELESEVSDLRDSAGAQERQLERLKADSESRQKLRDELQMLKVERDDLLQKSKASDNLKKKIQSLQETDKSNQSLRQEIESLQGEAQKTKTYRDKCVSLQKTNEEKMKTIANQEREIFDQKSTRKRLDQEVKLYASKMENAKEQKQRDSDTIQELEERLRDSEAGQGKVSQDLAGNLDDELSSKDKVYIDLYVSPGIGMLSSGLT